MIKFLVMDVDGTLTDGSVYIGDNGESFKKFDIKDGYGIKFLLKQKEIIPVIITARNSKALTNRCKELDISYLYQGSTNKLETLESIINEYNNKNDQSYNLSNVAYIGDDLIDLPCMKVIRDKGGFIACPHDAAKEIKQVASYICERDGGKSAVREFIEYLVEDKYDYLSLTDKISRAVRYLNALPKAISAGVYEVDDSFYYKVIEYNTKEDNKCVFESHERYIDIQIILEGKERMDVIETNSLIPSTEYNEEEDVIFYNPSTPFMSITLTKGSNVVLWPNNAHRGCIMVDAKTNRVKKIVGKLLTK